jgi:hypothetical protein
LIGVVAHAANGWAWPVMQRLGVSLPEESEDPTLELVDWKNLQPWLEARGYWERLKLSAMVCGAGTPQRDNCKVHYLFLAAPRWHVAGKVARAVGCRVPVVCLHEDPRNLAQIAPQTLWLGGDALIVFPPGRYGEMLMRYDTLFDSVQFIEAVPITRGGRMVDVLEIYLGKNFRAPHAWPAWAQ